MTLHIQKLGRGATPLVLAHGWAMHGGVFAPLVDALTDTCTLYVVDLPGHGHSRHSEVPFELAACAKAIADATPPAAWLGWSLGGLIALTAALDMPDHVKALAMLSASPKFSRDADWPHGADPNLVRTLARDLQSDYHATLERFMALEAMGSDDPRAEVRRLRAEVFSRGEPDPRVLQQGIALLEHTDLRAALPTLTMRNGWFVGRRDRVVHPKAVRWSADAAGGTFHEIEHAGHAPFMGHALALARALEPLLTNAP